MMGAPNLDFHTCEKFHKIVYKDTSEGRISVAQRLYLVCKLDELNQQNSKPKMEDCYKHVKDLFMADCKKKTKQSKEDCEAHLNNGFWQACQSVEKFYNDCDDYTYKGVSTVDLSAPWLWGVGGWLTGAIVAAAVWVLVYFVFLRKKAPKK